MTIQHESPDDVRSHPAREGIVAQPQSEIERIFDFQSLHKKMVRASGRDERLKKLQSLHDALWSFRTDIHEALHADLAKHPVESDLSEIYPVLSEARHVIEHLDGWMSPRSVATPLSLIGSQSETRYEPKGMVLIISPWNFPITLSLGPLLSAIAAGNCVIVKPSELTPNTSRCLRRIIEAVFPQPEVAVIEGGPAVAQELLAKRFDHIFFTGSPRVGKLVMKAAADHLSSVTLELGGKSPVIVDASADLHDAAEKILWGKFVNNGQTCIAPDYVLVAEPAAEELERELIRSMEALYGKSDSIGSNSDYGRVVDSHHHDRLTKLLNAAVAGGARMIAGGEHERSSRFIAPTILIDVDSSQNLLNEEIFGPILPIVRYRTTQEAIDFVNQREKPLALYIFSRDSKSTESIIASTSAGGTCVNHTLVHFFNHNLPFGGVNGSGFGRSHGFAGFEAFSNKRSILRQRTRWSAIRLMFPPYSERVQKIVNLAMKYF